MKLAVEIDGDSHFREESRAVDKLRQAFIESFDIQFSRFTNEHVYRNMEGVLETVRRMVLEISDR